MLFEISIENKDKLSLVRDNEGPWETICRKVLIFCFSVTDFLSCLVVPY